MGHFLVIGGSGVMGTAAIQAVRAHFKNEATIIANWYGKEDPDYRVEQADHTVFGDITDPNCIDKILALHSGKFDYMFYATALGDVGFAISQSTPEQIAQSNKLSFDPIPALEGTFEIGTLVAYSTFYLLKHQLCSYGAMGYSKEAIEKWTLEPGKAKHACIRAGLFESQSSRGIKLLLRKKAKRLDEIQDPLLRSYFENRKSKEGIELFLRGIINEEKERYGDSPTNQGHLVQAHMELFKSEPPLFVNVCGNKIWKNMEIQNIPPSAD